MSALRPVVPISGFTGVLAVAASSSSSSGANYDTTRETVRVRDRFVGRNDGRAKWAGRRRLWFGNAGQEQEARREVGRARMVSLTKFDIIFP